VLTIPTAVKLWYCPEATDMRLGFDGLFSRVRSRLNADPLSGHLFIFRNRSADRLKILYWGGHGANASKPVATTSPTPRRRPPPSNSAPASSR
jgi:transposase